MTKKEFLKELEDRLQMLDEKERKDMIEEYSQHISMRIESGMKEKEAIDDFGDIDDLIAEILEAYHLNPEYEMRNKEKKGKVVTDLLPEDFFVKRKKRIRGKSGTQSGQSELEELERIQSKVSKKQKMTDVADKAVKKSSNVISWSWNKIKRVAVGFMKIVLLFLVLPAAFCDLGGLFVLGILLVMAFQGYPVIGGVIIVFGAILSMTAYILFLFTYIVKRRAKA